MANAKEIKLSFEQSSKLQLWQRQAEAVKASQEVERKLRAELIAELFSAAKDEGTETIGIGNGWKLKATKKLDYKILDDEDKLEAFEEFFTKLPGGDMLIEALVSYKPSLSVSAYKNALPLWLNTITDDSLRIRLQAMLADFITIKPASPSLELVDPNAK